MKEPWTHEFGKVNGIRMHYVTQGDGKLLLLLHGFPDFWYVWRFQIPELAKQFRVVAPDLRGYNRTDKPEGVDNYRLNLLADDIVGLIKGLGEERAIVIGHDWGGAVGWSLAAFSPSHVEQLVILNAPHPNAYVQRTRNLLRQLQKSWYIFFFQTLDVPENVLSRNNFAFLKSMVRRSFVKRDVLTDEDWALYEKAWSRPGALKAAINYYRATLTPAILFAPKPMRFPKIKVPTLIIWGEQDAALSKDLTANMDEFIESAYSVKYLPHCGHWAQLEDPTTVNEHILDFLT